MYGPRVRFKYKKNTLLGIRTVLLIRTSMDKKKNIHILGSVLLF